MALGLGLPMQDSLFASEMFGPLINKSPGPSRASLLDRLSRPLSLDEYHEERESIRSLKEFYEEYKPESCLPKELYEDCKPQSCSAHSIGLPPGLEDFAEANQNSHQEFFHSAFDFAAPQFWTTTEQQSVPLDFGSESFSIGGQPVGASEEDFDDDGVSFGASEQTLELAGQPLNADAAPFKVCAKQLNANAQPFELCGKPLNADAQPFDVSAKPLNADALPFELSEKPIQADARPVSAGGKPLNPDAQPFNANVKSLNAKAQPFDMGQACVLNADAIPFDMCGRSFDVSGPPDDILETFDVVGELFQIQDHSFDASVQVFEIDTPWCQPQASWDTVLSTQPARPWIA